MARISIYRRYIHRARLVLQSLGRHASKGRVVSERRQYGSRRRRVFSLACSVRDARLSASHDRPIESFVEETDATGRRVSRDNDETHEGGLGLLSSVKDCLAGAGATRRVSNPRITEGSEGWAQEETCVPTKRIHRCRVRKRRREKWEGNSESKVAEF